MNSLFLLCYAPREATISRAAFWQSRKRGIVLSGTKGEAEAHFKVPGKRVVKPDDLLLYSLEVAGTDGYWVEFSRPLIQAHVSPRTAAMRDVYPEALEAARLRMREGEPISNVHRAATEVFARRGFGLGHLSGHSIGTTMIKHPAVGANTNTVLRENMILTFHPQVIDQDGKVCLYTQDTYRVGQRRKASVWQMSLGASSLERKPAITRTEDRFPVVKA